MSETMHASSTRRRHSHLWLRSHPLGGFFTSVMAVALLVFCSGALAAGGVVTRPEATTAGTNSHAGGTTIAPNPGASGVEIAPALYQQLASGEHRDFAIEFRERADLSGARLMDWTARGRYVYSHLRETADRSQASVRRMLEQRGVNFKSYWIKNAILVSGGDMATLHAASVFGEVARIRELPKTDLIRPENPTDANSVERAANGVTENVAWVGADQVWAAGTTGDGVTVGIIDDGVFYTHEAVVAQYRGNLGAGGFDHDYNWYSPLVDASEPNGNQGFGHGTHVTGTIVGDNHASDSGQRERTGMAPGAKWIACLGITAKFSELALPGCGEFMLAPTKVDGSAPDPDRRPQIVNNSWGFFSCDGSADDFYRDIVEAWIAAGIFPVFSAGNAGNCNLPNPPGLSTVTNPASLGSSFAVGSSGNHDGQYAAHSNWGPSLEASAGLPAYPDTRGYPTMKPQVVAPGVNIRSAIDEGSRYETLTGTSMSAPHVSGLVALMLDAGECLRGDYATLGGLIMQSARPIDYESGGEPPPGIGNLPNYATGWGEIDAPRAVDAAARACGPQGTIRGVVTSPSGAPVAGAKVEIFADEAVRIYQATTDTDGSYARRLPVDDGAGYHVRVSAYGYLPDLEASVFVRADTITSHDVQLATAAIYKIAGRVTDSATGWALHAKVVISGYPDGPIWSDPLTGDYSVRLPEGRAYRFDVTSDIDGYLGATRELASLAGGGTQNFSLVADPVACSAPGYAYGVTLSTEDFENNGAAPPGGWSRSSAGLGWLFGTSADLSGAIVFPEHGRFAAVYDDLAAGGAENNDGRFDNLQLPTMDLAATVNPVLRYRSYFITGVRSGVEGSMDGGATWRALGGSQIFAWDGRFNDEVVDLSTIAAAGANARIRFHSDDGSIDGSGAGNSFWAVDDVAIHGACTPPATGGLVVGHVRDANHGYGLNGATVSVDGGRVVTSYRNVDSAVGDGFYALHAPVGTPTLLAQRGSQPVGYGDASGTPSVANGATVIHELALPAGRLRQTPIAPTASLELGTTTTVPFTVANTGTLPLTFAFERTAVEEHFDTVAFPPGEWTVENGGLGDGCTWSYLDPDQEFNFAGGDTGAAKVAPCFATSDTDTALISPRLDLSTSHTASMGFLLSYLAIDAPARFDVDASTDGGQNWTTLFTETHYNNGEGSGAFVQLDLSEFVGAQDVRVRFHYKMEPHDFASRVLIDQIHLFNSISASAILILSPENGSLAIGENRTLQATFDARTVAQPGVYTVQFNTVDDTPYSHAFDNVDATMTVTAPASYGSLAGSIGSLGYCDAEPAALRDAAITIRSSTGQVFTTTSSAEGSYLYWLEAAQGPYSVAVEAEGHVTQTWELAVAAGVETATDLNLRALQPCLQTDPSAPGASVDSGQTTQLPFDLLNLGAAAADWTIRAGGDPIVPSIVPLVQTTSPTPVQGFSFGCGVPGGSTLENRYMRRFDLAERGVPIQDTTVAGINFAIDTATSDSGTQPIVARLYSLTGELALANLHLLGEKFINIDDTGLQRVSVAFDTPTHVAGDSVLVAEIYVPTNAENHIFYPGGNGDGESAPAYWASPDCGVDELVPFASQGVDFAHLILEIDMLESDPCGVNAIPVDWLGFPQSNGHVDGDGMNSLLAAFSAANHANGDYRGSMCMTPGRSSAQPVVVPVSMHVGAVTDVIFESGFE